MSDKPFSTYSGKFICQKCGEQVAVIRVWHETLDATWMCSKKHISKVTLYRKKTKKDYEREEREQKDRSKTT